MKRNFIFMCFTLFLRLFTNMLLFILLARVWSVEDFGKFMYCFTISNLLILLIDYGFPLKLVKDISINIKNINHIFITSIWSKLWLTIVALLLFLFGSRYLFDDDYTFYVALILVFSAILNSFTIHFTLPHRALNKFEVETKLSFSNSCMFFIVFSVLLFFTPSILEVAFAYLFIRLTNLINSIITVKKHLKLKFNLLRKIKGSLKYIISNSTFAIHLILGSLYFQIDTMLIQKLLGNEQVAYYQAPMRLIMGSLILMQAISNSSLPLISKLSEDNNKLIEFSKSVNEKALGLGGLITIVFSLFSEEVINFFYGYSYATSATIFGMLSIVVFLRYFTTIYGVVITVINKQTMRALIAAIALILSVLFNLIFISMIGIYGAVLSLILTTLLILCFYIILVNKAFGDHLFSNGGNIIIVLVGICCILPYFTNLNFYLKVSIVIIYLSVVIFVLGKDKVRGVLDKNE
ncbi:oligosaccharide flippase family protein [Neobacillus niacini]|uniref:oligosaccharide flippase family protein n=1 Tax=Neobacillus niacini TaxID=86668 RepID=UPI0007AC2B19|nr:oligosaccharide flippase family protein [Neobacillus niacini]